MQIQNESCVKGSESSSKVKRKVILIWQLTALNS